MVERTRRPRMGLANSSPGASGVTARPNYVGPSGNGLVERMNAGAKNPAGSRSLAIAAPFRFQKAVPRTKEKRRGEAPIGAPVRVMGRLFPPAGGTGFAARRPPGAAFRTSACRRFATPRTGVEKPQTATGRPLPRDDGAWFAHAEHKPRTRR